MENFHLIKLKMTLFALKCHIRISRHAYCNNKFKQMLKRVIVDIMQHITPAFIVVCVLLCLSLNLAFPLHRHRLKLTALLNGSQQCASAKKLRSTARQAIEFKSSSDTSYYPNADSKLSGDDLRRYEQLVIMKKYPYLDLKQYELKYRPSAKIAKYARDAGLADGGNCQLTDDGPRVEISSRGISGFGIPHPAHVPPAAVGAKHDGQGSGQ